MRGGLANKQYKVRHPRMAGVAGARRPENRIFVHLHLIENKKLEKKFAQMKDFP
jgi:hypothetical protein